MGTVAKVNMKRVGSLTITRPAYRDNSIGQVVSEYLAAISINNAHLDPFAKVAIGKIYCSAHRVDKRYFSRHYFQFAIESVERHNS